LLCLNISSIDIQTIDINGSAGSKRFDGTVAVGSDGLTSGLLKNYPKPQRSHVLDLLFKSNSIKSVFYFLTQEIHFVLKTYITIQ
jgi:hypothetical protein